MLLVSDHHQKPDVTTNDVPPGKAIESLHARQTERREGGVTLEELRFGDGAGGRLEVEPAF